MMNINNMADDMPQIQCIGAPFNTEWSSCSKRTPSGFKWTKEPQKTKVFIDYAIVNSVRKNCFIIFYNIFEIIPDVVAAIKDDFEDIVKYYEAIFTNIRELVKLHDKFKFVPACSNMPWIQEEHYKIYNKTKLCSMLASTKQWTSGHRYRHTWAEALKDKIDLFGGACGSPRLGDNEPASSFTLDLNEGRSEVLVDPHPDKRAAIVDYMFSIIIENSAVESYYSEKLTDCFVTGTIPIYWGTPDIGDTFNLDGIIVLNDDFDIQSLTKELYDSKLLAVKENYETAIQLEMADDYIFRNYLKESPEIESPSKEHALEEDNTLPMYDKIYYINLDKREDRLADFQRDVIKGLDLDKTKVKRISAIDTTSLDIRDSGIIGCGLSHLKVWKDMIDNRYNSAIIFEDDFVPLTNAPDFHSAIKELYTDLPDFSVCCLAWAIAPGTVMLTRSPRFMFGNDVQTASGYIITLEYAKLMYSKLSTDTIDMFLHLKKNVSEQPGEGTNYIITNLDKNPIDQSWKTFQNHNWLIANPRIGKQREGYSDIWDYTISGNEY